MGNFTQLFTSMTGMRKKRESPPASQACSPHWNKTVPGTAVVHDSRADVPRVAKATAAQRHAFYSGRTKGRQEHYCAFHTQAHSDENHTWMSGCVIQCTMYYWSTVMLAEAPSQMRSKWQDPCCLSAGWQNAPEFRLQGLARQQEAIRNFLPCSRNW